jgi:hypothetical protein
MPKKASDLLEAMRHSKSKWKRKDLVSLYEGHGFVIESRSKHDLVTHPDFPQLVTYLPRHNRVAKYLVTTAVRMVDRLNALRQEEGARTDE